MTKKTKIIVFVIYTALCVASGRYLVPTKETSSKQVDESSKSKEEKSKEEESKKTKGKKKTTTIIEITLPDGTKKKTTTTTDEEKEVTDNKKKTDSEKEKESEKKTDETKTVERSTGRVTISALAALKLDDLTKGPAYGGMVTWSVLGPISVTGFGLTNSTFGLGIGLTF